MGKGQQIWNTAVVSIWQDTGQCSGHSGLKWCFLQKYPVCESHPNPLYVSVWMKSSFICLTSALHCPDHILWLRRHHLGNFSLDVLFFGSVRLFSESTKNALKDKLFFKALESCCVPLNGMPREIDVLWHSLGWN